MIRNTKRLTKYFLVKCENIMIKLKKTMKVLEQHTLKKIPGKMLNLVSTFEDAKTGLSRHHKTL